MSAHHLRSSGRRGATLTSGGHSASARRGSRRLAWCAAVVLPTAVLAAVPVAPAVASDCEVPSSAFPPGSWLGTGSTSFSSTDEIGALSGTTQLRFELSVDNGGVISSGTFSSLTDATNQAFDGASGSDAIWTVEGAISGVAGTVAVDGEMAMEMSIAQDFIDVGGDLNVGIEDAALTRPVSFTFAPGVADCSLVAGEISGAGAPEPVPFAAFRTARATGPSPSERYGEVTARAAALASAETLDHEELLLVIRDVIGLIDVIAQTPQCVGAGSSARVGNPRARYTAHLLRAVLQQFAALAPSYDTPTIVEVMTLAFQASGITEELCEDVYVDSGGVLATLEAELLERLRRSIVDGDTAEYERLVAVTYQFGLPSLQAMLDTMGGGS